MKYSLIFLFLLLPIIAFSQDSTYFKGFEADRQQLESSLQKTQQQFTELTTETNRLEGALGYLQTLDSSLQKTKEDYKILVDNYSKAKTKVVEAQIQIYLLKGYLEYNSLLLQREQEKFKK